ncbi:PAC2 family protein [Luteipulveratus halotolerans]|uniref:Proteasome protein n=1 Tax=Luteipulveratus halotolerans TaxID=1631356 RepID=A0A0L6CGC0_9MICO|nr:PAC2 family protein [Luteipulveratus halotolerans]KNX36871.1 proteasome protein [Luteipulveratus halotolerans]
MQDPSQLFQLETDTPQEDLRASTMIVSFGGLIDAGQAQKLLTDHILETLDSQVVASFDIDQLLDYRGRRPVMTFDRDHIAAYDDPTLLLHRVVDEEGTPFYVLYGPEPDYQWERVIEAVRQLIRMLGVRLVISAHGIPMGVPHTRPVGMTRYATDRSLIPENDPVFGAVQIPASLEQLLHLRLGESGTDAVGFALHVPHYLAQVEFGDAAVAALEAIHAQTGLAIPVADLAAAAGLNRADIQRQIADNDEVTQVVSGLEQQYDAFHEGRQRKSLLATEMAELPSADEIGEQLEAFLREETADDETDEDAGPDFLR